MIIWRLHTFGEVVIEQSLETPTECVLHAVHGSTETNHSHLKSKRKHKENFILVSQTLLLRYLQTLITYAFSEIIHKQSSLWNELKYKTDILLFFIKACTLKHIETKRTSNKIAYQMHSIFFLRHTLHLWCNKNRIKHISTFGINKRRTRTGCVFTVN